jgi:hypothetical protein
MCKFHILGMCAKGSDCCFAHDQAEMNPIPDLSRTKICKTLINTGMCTDENCKYAHNKDELRDLAPGAITDDLPGRQRCANVAANAVEAGSSFPTTARPGGAEDAVAAQTMLQMQQWMSMMQYAMMSRQPEGVHGTAVGYPEMQQQHATAPFLYNALFEEAPSYCPDAKAPPPRPSKSKISVEPSSWDKSATCQQDSPTKCVCGNNLRAGIKFCPNCGMSCLALKAQRYDVKNTFVEIPDEFGANKLGVRNVQSASATLNSYLDDSPMTSPSGDVTMGGILGVSCRMPRSSTWASDLGTLAEESDDALREKRLQDTPLGSCFAVCDEAFPVDTTAISPEEGMLAMENMRVKNTFLEFKTDEAPTGMRMVRTAAGRLDLMGCESGSWNA